MPVRHKTEKIILEDNEGNTVATIEDTADGGKLTLYDGTGTEQGEVFLQGGDGMRVDNLTSGDLRIQPSEGDVLFNTLEGGGAGGYIMNILELVRLQKLSFNGKAVDSAPTASNGDIYLASPTWDPDGDGNGEIVCYDGTAWQEVVDLPNYT